MNKDFITALESFDLKTLREIRKRSTPNMPVLSDPEFEIMIHITRTNLPIDFRARAYSHSWLSERGMPSKLPDELKPKAERMYPQKTYAVGVASSTNGPATLIVRKAVTDAIEDIAADGKLLDHDLVSARMREMREKEKRALFGRWGK